jgi:hypothetical protein
LSWNFSAFSGGVAYEFFPFFILLGSRVVFLALAESEKYAEVADLVGFGACFPCGDGVS